MKILPGQVHKELCAKFEWEHWIILFVISFIGCIDQYDCFFFTFFCYSTDSVEVKRRHKEKPMQHLSVMWVNSLHARIAFSWFTIPKLMQSAVSYIHILSQTLQIKPALNVMPLPARSAHNITILGFPKILTFYMFISIFMLNSMVL